MRKSGITFKAVTNAIFAISHAERTELSPPGYLLPESLRLGNVIMDGSYSEADIAEAFAMRKSKLSRQAKTAGASPFWEGVMVLPEVADPINYGEVQAMRLEQWKAHFQEATGMTVLHMVIHLDEGYLGEDGRPVYNPHAHVMVDRCNAQNRIIKLNRTQLSKVQDLTASVMRMKRGSTLAERGGKASRRHIDHKTFRAEAEAHRAELNEQKGYSREAIDGLLTMGKASEQRADKAEREAIYRELRGWLKGSARATQADYSALKLLHNSEHSTMKISMLQRVMDEGFDVLSALHDAMPVPTLKPETQRLGMLASLRKNFGPRSVLPPLRAPASPPEPEPDDGPAP